MYKSKLQELCQKQKWALPKYTCIKDGEDHCPLFKASVLVHGVNFNSSPSCKSSKQAHNHAAQLAFLHFSSEPTNQRNENLEKTKSEKEVQSSKHSEDLAVNNCDSLEHTTQRNGELEKSNSEKEVQSSMHSQDLAVNNCDDLDKHNEFKKKLQIYAQKRNLNRPVYRNKKDGLLFWAKVSIDDEEWFQSPKLCQTIEEAQDSAAQAALLSLVAL